MTTDHARAILADPRAPADERYDAQVELQKSVMPTSSDIIPGAHLAPLIDFIKEAAEETEFQKSLAANNVIPFPSRAAREKKPGMQSVYIDENTAFGDYMEKPGAFSFDAMRQMVAATPILNSIIMTRVRQVQRFSRVQRGGKGPGFQIRLKDDNAKAGEIEKAQIQELQSFMTNCGNESNPRQRARLRRDNFTSFLSKFTRDSLVLDSAPIETEFKRNKKLGMDGFYAVDGATIRLCTEVGYQGDDDIRAVQIVQGQIRSAYTFDDLIYQPRNDVSDIANGGYGMSETEVLVRTVTYLLNAMTYNGKFFDSNSIPKGLLHLSGSYDEKDLNAFKRQWSGMVKGINNAWAMPVMVSKDQESKAAFEKFGVDVDEMMFGKWITLLVSVACAVYGIAPDEINMESFRTTAGGLNGGDTEEKITSSKDKGLRPLLAYSEETFSDFIISDFFDGKYVFEFTGLDDEDEERQFERDKLVLTVNEMRQQGNMPDIEDAWGNAPINPSLLAAWQAENQQNQEDYGLPGADGDAQAGDDDEQDGQQDFGDGGDKDFGDGQADTVPADPNTDPAEMQKAFGLPVFRIET